MSDIAEQCPSNVYDEFSSPVDPALLRVIALFTSKGVDVRVYNVETMTDEGADLSAQMSDDEFYENAAEHTEEIIDVCAIPTDNTLMLVRAVEDQYLDIVTAGDQTDFKARHEGAFNTITDGYFDDARSGGTDTLDSDAAKALERLYELEFGQREDQQQVERPNVSPPKDVDTTSDLPAVPSSNEEGTPGVTVEPTNRSLDRGDIEIVGGVLAVATVAALVVGGLRKRSDAKRDFAGAKQHLMERLTVDSDSVSEIFDGKDDEESFMVLLPEDENPELKQLWTEVVNEQEEWNNLYESVKETLFGLGGLWPPVNKARELRDHYDEASRNYTRKVNSYIAQIKELNQLKEGLNGQRDLASDALKDTKDMFLRLTKVDEGATPYEIPGMDDKITSIEARLAAANELMANGYIRQPQSEYAALLAEMKSTVDRLEDVPSDHARVIEEYKSTMAEVVSAENQLTVLYGVVDEIKNTYNDDCWGEVETNQASADEIHAAVLAAKESIPNPSTVYNTDQFDEIEQSLRAVSSQCEDLAGLARSVNSQKNKLTGVVEALPGQLSRTWATLEEARDYIEEYAEFIDDPTEMALSNLVPALERLQAELGGEKPSYLRLHEESRQLHQKVQDGFNHAKGDYAEFMQLLEGVSQKTATFQQELSSLQSYEATHGEVDRDTETDIEDLALPGLPTERSRAALRHANDLLDQAIDGVRSVAQDAHSDVRREEKRKEAEREAKRRVEAAKRAAEQADKDRERAREDRERAARLAATMSTTTFSHSPNRGGGGIGHAGRRG